MWKLFVKLFKVGSTDGFIVIKVKTFHDWLNGSESSRIEKALQIKLNVLQLN